MLTTIIFENQIILPGKVAMGFQGTEYFRATVEDGRIALTPTDYTTGEILHVEGEVARQKVGKRMEELGITEDDIPEIVAEARRKHNRGV